MSDVESELDLLKRDHASMIVMFNERADTIASLLAEIGRLRAALSAIVNKMADQGMSEWKIAKMAKRALKQEQPR